MKLDRCCHRLTHKRLAFSTIYPLFVERFGRSLRFYNIEYDKEAISDGRRSVGFWILSDFRELSLCGPCGP